MVKKNILMVVFLLVLILVLVTGTDIQSVDEYYLMHMEDIQEDSETVTISIRCDSILNNWEKLDKQLRNEKYVPTNGIILKESTYVLRPGDTVYDILNRVCRYNKIHMEYQGAEHNSFSSVYIRGINYLYEFSCGPLSGWQFRVNGKYPGVGCSNYKLQDKDKIEWIYTCDLGRDIGNEMKKNQKKGDVS